jgi:hypothetical protein
MKSAPALISRSVAACLLLASSTPALAWGWQGHEYVGNVAWQLLNPKARRQVSALLGPDTNLALATVWADCAKTVLGPPDYGFTKKFTPGVCKSFSTADQQHMWDYVHRNWSNCIYSHKKSECHKAFHFADVNVHDHQDYDANYFGAQPYDVVHAIKATMVVLKCRTGQACHVPEPFNILDKREALLLLSHFVGDLHQPLHVGAVYLDDNSIEAAGDNGNETVGGNSLLMTKGGDNLHHFWDSVPDADPSPTAIDQACLIAPLPNPTPEPVETWATESVAAARVAYTGMSFAPVQAKDPTWQIQFANEDDYKGAAGQTQAKQLIKAGARLATLINSIWPSKKVAAACR